MPGELGDRGLGAGWVIAAPLKVPGAMAEAGSEGKR